MCIGAGKYERWIQSEFDFENLNTTIHPFWWNDVTTFACYWFFLIINGNTNEYTEATEVLSWAFRLAHFLAMIVVECRGSAFLINAMSCTFIRFVSEWPFRSPRRTWCLSSLLFNWIENPNFDGIKYPRSWIRFFFLLPCRLSRQHLAIFLLLDRESNLMVPFWLQLWVSPPCKPFGWGKFDWHSFLAQPDRESSFGDGRVPYTVSVPVVVIWSFHLISNQIFCDDLISFTLELSGSFVHFIARKCPLECLFVEM